MPASTVRTFISLEQIAGREAELARWLHAQFRRRLSAEDTRDAVADAITVAHEARESLEALTGEQLEAWVRTRAYRNAIDQIRAVDGYGQERRKATVNVDDVSETLAVIDEEIAAQFADGSAAQSVGLALERLTPDERRLLRLRHYDNLDVKTIAALLDIHPKKYERLHTRAIGKLRTIFIETAAGENCEPVRRLIVRARQEPLGRELSATIAAHVEACEQCRAYEKRCLKLIAALPLPAPALLDRVWSRAHELLPSLAGHGEGVAAGGTAAAAGGTASTGVLGGLGAKAVIALCGGAAVTATCVGALTLPPVLTPSPKPKRADGTAQKAQQSQTAARPVAVQRPVLTPRTAATTGTKAKSATQTTSASRKAVRNSSFTVDGFGTPVRSNSAPPPPPLPPPPSGGTTEFGLP